MLDRKVLVRIIISSSVALVIGLVLLNLLQKEPSTYKECVDQGNIVRQTDPPVCITSEGKEFIK